MVISQVAGPFWPAPINAPGSRLTLREATLAVAVEQPTLLLTLCFVLVNMLKGSNGTTDCRHLVLT